MNDNGSLYDFVNEDYEAPTVASKPVATPHANRQNLGKPYVQDIAISSKVKAAPVHQQKDNSYYAWDRFWRYAPCADSFEQSINIEVGRGNLNGENFQEMKVKYINLYKSKL